MQNQVVATSGAGSWLQSGNSFLSAALNTWGKVEEIKAARSAAGQDQTLRTIQTDYANGAAVQVDAPAVINTDSKPKGIEQYMPLFVAVLGAGILFKLAGYK